MKLFLVVLRGMQTSAGSTVFGRAYVVAEDPQKAYAKVRERLDADDIGFSQDRELDSVTLLAEDTQYPDCQTILYT